MSMNDLKTLCQQFAHILGGEMKMSHGACTVNKDRSHIRVTVLGRPSHSGLVSSMCLFESVDQTGKALNLGETTLLEDEVYPFIWNLQRNGILITALHNHWLFENPRLLYAHYMSIEDPLSFARKVAEANKVLK